MSEITRFLFDSNVRKYRFNRFSAKQKTLERYTNQLKDYNIAMGDWQSPNNTCISGRRPPNKRFTEMLCKKNPNVAFIDEYNTSKKCANCFSILKQYDPEQEKALETSRYSKLRKCTECNHVIHRDQNGSRNIMMLYQDEVKNVPRNKEFCRKNGDGIFRLKFSICSSLSYFH